jgi:hypothetical protein
MTQPIEEEDGGYTEAQLEYLRSVVGITWAKAFRAGETSARSEALAADEARRLLASLGLSVALRSRS